jgi:hypothetical protein
MKSKYAWGVAVLTVLLVIGNGMYRQMKKTLEVIYSAFSNSSFNTYMAW